MSFQYIDSLSGNAKTRYHQKLGLIGLKECPYKIPQGSWKNDPTKWPSLEYGDMYTYLIETPGVYTRESMKNRKSLEAHIYFESGWVETVFSYEIPDSRHVILTANVKPSQRVNDEPHRPWVALTTDAVVSSAHCNCMAGLGESCSHIGALLYKVEAAVRLGYTKQACTDLPCKWNNDFVKKVLPEPVHRIKFYKEARTEKAKKRLRRRNQVFAKSTDQDQNRFLEMLQEGQCNPVVLSCFNGFSDKFHWSQNLKLNPELPKPLRKLYSEENASLTLTELHTKCQEIASSFSLSADEVEFVSKSTEQQSDCLQWYEQRCGRITSSVVHSVLHTDQNKPCRTVMKQICFPETFTSKAIKWGKDHEKKAVQAYTQLLQSSVPQHKNLKISKSGLKISQEKPYLAASADSITCCDCHGKRVLEVKCPYSHRKSTFQEFLNDKKCYVKGGTLLKNHQYYSQVQLQMYVYNTASCDFFVWTEKFCLLLYVNRDDKFIQNMLLLTERFFVSNILQELLTRKIEHATLKVNSGTQKNPLFCICQSPEDDREYIGCDNPQCPYKWFHLECLKLKRAPKGEWYCLRCRKGKSEHTPMHYHFLKHQPAKKISWKTLGKVKKLLVTGNFFIFYDIFK